MESETRKRDEYFNGWKTSVNLAKNDHEFVTYYIFTDCHHQNYFKETLQKAFDSTPKLFELVDGYLTANTISMDQAINCSDKMTFIAIVKGHTGSANSLKPIFKLDIYKKWQRKSRTDDNETLLLTRDYLKYLQQHFDFKITKIENIYFFRKCNILPLVYKQLLEQRQLAENIPCRKMLIKNVINYSCGFCGLNSEKIQSSTFACKLVSKASRLYNLEDYKMVPVGEVGNTTYSIAIRVKSFSSLQKCQFKQSNSALPIFVSIIEAGKMRMSEVLCFFDTYLINSAFKHVYSNCDNVLMVLSTTDLDSAVKPHLFNEYAQQKLNFFAAGQAGHLKHELSFLADTEWKLITPTVQNWACCTKDNKYDCHKSSSINNVTTLEVYNMACNLLQDKKFTIPQTRRINKMVNTDSKVQSFTF